MQGRSPLLTTPSMRSVNTFHLVSPKAVKKAPKGVTHWGLIRVKLQLPGRKRGQAETLKLCKISLWSCPGTRAGVSNPLLAELIGLTHWWFYSPRKPFSDCRNESCQMIFNHSTDRPSATRRIFGERAILNERFCGYKDTFLSRLLVTPVAHSSCPLSTSPLAVTWPRQTMATWQGPGMRPREQKYQAA